MGCGRCAAGCPVTARVSPPPGTADAISPWELQLEEQEVYKYANVPRGSTLTLSCMLTTSWLRSRVLCALAHSSVAVLFGVVTNGEAIAAAANEANGQRITHVRHTANHRQVSRSSLEMISHFRACPQDNFASVPKRVWADVVRKLGVNMNSRNAAADLFVPISVRFCNMLTPFARSLCASYIRLGCLACACD